MKSKSDIVRCSVSFCVILLVGIILFILGGILSIAVRSSWFSLMILAGIVVLISSLISLFCCSRSIESKRSNRVRETIRQESMKYSNRSPVPCSWKLETPRYHRSMYRRRRYAHLDYNVRRSSLTFDFDISYCHFS